jgi:hypothetical protein
MGDKIMRWTTASIAAITLAAAAPPLAAQPAGQEHLAAPALPGFIVGYTAANAQQSIREEVPRGETAGAWSRMVTTQRFGGTARAGTPEVYARNTSAGIPRACPGARVSPIASLRVSGRAAAQFQVDCPHSAGGRPETFILLAVAGPGGDMHVKQVAWRGGTTPQGLAWGRSFLAGVALCAAGDRTPACR